MKLKYTALFAAVLFMILLLNGCSLSVKPPDMLMAPPKLTGGFQDLQDEFEKVIGSDVTFITPVNGEHTSAFIVEDMNSDGKEDAIVFYSPKEGDETAIFSVFNKNEDDEWTFIKTVKGAGNSVDTVIIEDINNDKIKEVVVGWNLFTSKKQFTVYEPDNRSAEDYFRACGSSPYDLITTADLNGDENNELFFTLFDTTASVPEASASLAVIENSKMKILDKIVLDSNISGYSAVYRDTVDGQTVIYADALKNEHDMITEIILWDTKSSKLVDPVINSQNHTNTATWRNSRISVQDFDKDGHLEIPAGLEIPGSSVVVAGALQDETLCFTCWSSFNGTKLKAEKYMIYNDNEGYSLDIPSSWIGKISVTSLDSQLYFYRWNSGSREHMGNQLFSIVSHTTEAQSITGYQSIIEYDGRSFEYNITKDGESFGVTDQQIKEGFSLKDNS